MLSPREVEERRARMLKAIDESFGIMKRDETPEETVRQMKEASSQMWERRREYLDSIG